MTSGRRPEPQRKAAGRIWLAALLWLVLLPLHQPQAATQATAAAPAQTPASIPRPAAIPIDRIAPSAAEVSGRIRAFSAELTPAADVESIRAALGTLEPELDAALAHTEQSLAGQPSLEEIQAGDELWSRRQVLLQGWLATLTDRVTRLQSALREIETDQATWTATQETAQAGDYPQPVQTQIDEILAALAVLAPQMKARRDLTLDGQVRAAQGINRCEIARTRIAAAQAGAVGGILARDGRPLWGLDLWSEGIASLPGRLRQVATGYAEDLKVYLRDPNRHAARHGILFVATLLALIFAGRRVSHWATQGEDVRRMTAVSEHPLAAAILILLFAATSFWSTTPAALEAALIAVAQVPMVILVRPMVPRALRPVLYTLGLLVLLDTFRHAFGGVPALVGQMLLFTESLAGGLALVRLLRHLYRTRDKGQESELGWVWRSIAWFALFQMLIGLLASLLGYLRIARLTTPAVLVGGGMALGLYVAQEVALAVLDFAFRVRPLRLLRMVDRHREQLLARLRLLLIWGSAGSWVFRYLDYLGLWDPVRDTALAALQQRLAFGSFSTSATEILAFGLTLWGAYLLSATLRFVLEEEVYPRTGISTGISYAASSLLQYLIGIAGFFLALGFLGITLTQVTVFAGAIGVGVGLGLQGVVQNFVSGLILLFEQPIHVGDAVQVSELQGRVRRIGIRASVIRTFDGSEVIIPNSQLTTNQVTNWTLSDEERRVHVPVGLAYGTAPDQARDLLEGVAINHPKVLADPPPQCLFIGYGDSSVNFELRAWAQYSDAIQVTSELTAAIYDAVYKAGLSFPFPQREVRLLGDPTHSPESPGSRPASRACPAPP